ncbi:phage tail assembly chaperone [Sporosarcina sp. FSL K6-1508]|uniref:phage tail assembly chaperone n=1 Tax=Sporosarcina sp. FSL K6-1508 TaxID=2921553 RepID=UPI0030FC4C42
MSNLNAFLAQNAVQEENEKYVASKRFIEPVIDKETGKQKIGEDKKPIFEPVKWEICSILPQEDELIRKGCTKRLPVPGKRNMFSPETDYNSYLAQLAVKCTVFPNLHSKELQDSYGVMGAEALLQVMLKPGEYQDYLVKVQEVNGFDVGITELVEEAKNS